MAGIAVTRIDLTVSQVRAVKRIEELTPWPN